MIFSFRLQKIGKKQKLSTLDTVESGNKEMGSLSYITSIIDIFLFLDMPTVKLSLLICQPACPKQFLRLPAQQKIKLPGPSHQRKETLLVTIPKLT